MYYVGIFLTFFRPTHPSYQQMSAFLHTHLKHDVSISSYPPTHLYLINNPKMFNGETDDLAIKPCIPQKNYFYEFVANVLRGDIGILIFDLH